jgi:hypothetical protein
MTDLCLSVRILDIYERINGKNSEDRYVFPQSNFRIQIYLMNLKKIITKI